MTTTIVTTQPMLPTISSTRYAVERDWHSGIFGCCSNIVSCLSGYFCTCCYGMYVATRLEENCLLPVCLPVCYIIPLRTKIRTENRIKGSICEDCLVGCFCHMCAICQIHRENIYAKKGRVLT
ncbi:placenta-specific gene 8 protein-like [Lytechinus variegatus]|uniref:placenta-specific gene 8 protein-like n=1 Tax=Lytechinus variegatus TaxID=7654 RepID=UPI001BB2A7B2|nr:placenta-specific gene 8 protein-like [Lytechinus variegatus]